MSSSTNEDREQSKTTNMEESNMMTIEFLRARLLSERSVSKSARQRADELAMRVEELEEQLKFVSLQRRKAEKATTEVLAILENHGISDVSEESSCSEQEDSAKEFTARNGSLTLKETSTNGKLRKEAYSSSEIESSPSTGRSLSWRSTKESQHSLEKKKYMDAVRRRSSFSSNSSSVRRVGKSCRRIRRRDTRSMDELQNDGTENADYSRDASNCSDGEPIVLAEGSGYTNGKGPPESPTQGPTSGTKIVNGHYFSVHEKDEDMESALQHQAQLIGQYEEQERAQREWEEKFRENNSATQDSCDPGIHSDVTEERFETKSPELSCPNGTMDSDNREMKQESNDACVGEEPQTSKTLPSLTNAENGSLQDGTNARESSASEFSFPMSERSDQEFLRKLDKASTSGCQNISPYSTKSPPLSTSSGSPSSFELAVLPQGSSNSLGSVLESLQRAKLSLNEKLSSYPSNSGTNQVDGFGIPYGTPGLFRLPTDYQSEATTGGQPSFANYPPEIAPARFLSKPLVESRSAFSDNSFLTVPHRLFTPETRLGVPHQRSLSLNQPRLSEAPSPSRMINHDSYRNGVLPPVTDSYPFLPDVTLRLPLNEEGASRNFPSSERGLPPVMRLSSYDGRAGPNAYR